MIRASLGLERNVDFEMRIVIVRSHPRCFASKNDAQICRCGSMTLPGETHPKNEPLLMTTSTYPIIALLHKRKSYIQSIGNYPHAVLHFITSI